MSISISQHVNTPGQGNRNPWRQYLMYSGHARLLLLSICIFFFLKKNSETFWFYSSSKKLKRNRKIAQRLRTFFQSPQFFKETHGLVTFWSRPCKKNDVEGALLLLDQMPGMGFVPNLVSFLKHLTVYLNGNILLFSSSLSEKEIKK